MLHSGLALGRVPLRNALQGHSATGAAEETSPVAAGRISAAATEEMSSVATEDITSAATEVMFSVAA